MSFVLFNRIDCNFVQACEDLVFMLIINIGGQINLKNVNNRPPKKSPKSKLWIGQIYSLIVLVIKLLITSGIIFIIRF
jgi:hypothetical protein